MCFFMFVYQSPHLRRAMPTLLRLQRYYKFFKFANKNGFFEKNSLYRLRHPPTHNRLTTETQPGHLLIIGNKNFHEMEYLFAFARLKEKVLKITLLGL